MSVLLDSIRNSRPSPPWRIFCGGIVVLIGLFLSRAAPTQAAANSITADSLSATAVAFELRYGSLPHPAAVPAPSSRDPWLARDKAQHVVFSGLWTLSTQYLLVNKADWSEGDALPVSIASSAVVSVAKELYDASRPAKTASGKDLVADAVGIRLAVGIILL